MDSKHYSLFRSTITLIATSLLMLETDQLGIFVLYKEHFFLCLISRCGNFLNSYRQEVESRSSSVLSSQHRIILPFTMANEYYSSTQG